jgi:hypothetical protein
MSDSFFTNAPILIEVVLVLGVAVGWGILELRSLDRAKKRREAAERAKADAADHR